MICWQMKLNKKFDRRDLAFEILFAVMAVYYGYRMFALTPWYDELYTYYCFISKGPLYAALHWPLPNNHVGYSALSGFLNYLGSSYIGLRGVSYLCALANLYLIYRLAGKWTKGWLPVAAVILYLSMSLVNQLAVQGRGYTLGITCFLLAFGGMTEICCEKRTRKKSCLIYVGSLVIGLYAVSSNVYWVVPLCISGGLYLLFLSRKESREEKRFFLKTDSGRKLLKLIAASVIAAALTIFLYCTIWLAIGSNLLVKDANSIYYGLGHIEMILKAPFAAIGRGMEYMLDTPYIQSEERAGFLGRLGSFLLSLSGYYYSFLAIPVMIIFGIGLIKLPVSIVKKLYGKEAEAILPELFLFMEILFVPVCLLIQCKRPYHRVFTYGGAVLALLIAWLVNGWIKWLALKLRGKLTENRLSFLFLMLTVILGVKCMFFSSYNSQYGAREHEIQQVLAHADIRQEGNYCVTDCNQEYLLYFLYGIRCENKQIEGSDMVILDKRMTDPDFDEMVWEFYHYYDSIPWEYVNENMSIAYESENYILFQTDKKESK